MPKALHEIGPGRAARYGLGMLQAALLRSFVVPPQLRAGLLRLFGAGIGADCVVHPVTFSNLYRAGFRGLRLGRECFVGEECFLDLAGEIHMGHQVTLAERVMILTHVNVGFRDHPLQGALPAEVRPVRIEDGVFVGSGATLLAGVRLGAGCAVGAGSLVREDVPASTLVAGNPARPIRPLSD